MARNSSFAVLSLMALGCSSICTDPVLPTCDIRDAACQQTAQELVVCLRGQATEEIPPVSVITPADLEARLREGADPMMMRMVHWEAALQLLGMLAPDESLFEETIEQRVTSVAAFYSTRDRDISVVDRGDPLDSGEAMAVLIHELVHAAQDEEVGIDVEAIETHEELLRLRLAVEGEATFYLFEALLWSEGVRAFEANWVGIHANAVRGNEEALDRAPSPYFVVYEQMPYVYGSRRDAATFLHGGDEAVRAILASPPDSSAAWLEDPFRALGSSAPRLADPPCAAAPAPAGFEQVDDAEMGALLVYAFVRRAGATHTIARGLARRVQRDDLVTYGGPAGSALAWRIAIEGAVDPALVSTLAAEGRRVAVADGVLTILASDDPVALADWTWAEASPACAAP